MTAGRFQPGPHARRAGKKGKAASPWSRTAHCGTRRAADSHRAYQAAQKKDTTR